MFTKQPVTVTRQLGQRSRQFFSPFRETPTASVRQIGRIDRLARRWIEKTSSNSWTRNAPGYFLVAASSLRYFSRSGTPEVSPVNPLVSIRFARHAFRRCVHWNLPLTSHKGPVPSLSICALLTTYRRTIDRSIMHTRYFSRKLDRLQFTQRSVREALLALVDCKCASLALRDTNAARNKEKERERRTIVSLAFPLCRSDIRKRAICHNRWAEGIEDHQKRYVSCIASAPGSATRPRHWECRLMDRSRCHTPFSRPWHKSWMKRFFLCFFLCFFFLFSFVASFVRRGRGNE